MHVSAVPWLLPWTPGNLSLVPSSAEVLSPSSSSPTPPRVRENTFGPSATSQEARAPDEGRAPEARAREARVPDEARAREARVPKAWQQLR